MIKTTRYVQVPTGLSLERARRDMFRPYKVSPDLLPGWIHETLDSRSQWMGPKVTCGAAVKLAASERQNQITLKQ